MKQFTLVVVTLLCLSQITFAIPRFTLMTGESCGSCHFNPTGGQLRNEEGWAKGKNALRMFKSESSDQAEISPKIGKNIYFGADFRSQYLAVFMDTLGSKSGFQNMTGSLYFGVQASEKVDLYASYEFLYKTWEAYAIAKVFPHDGYIKAGSFRPNFGLGLDDHTAYTRGGDEGLLSGAGSGFGFKADYHENGVELGYYFGDNLFVTGSVATPNQQYQNTANPFQRDPNYTVSAQFLNSVNEEYNYLLGASYANTKSAWAGTFSKASKSAGFAGFGFKGFNLLAEYDLGKGLYLGDDTTTTALMIEASYRLTKGLDAMVRYDSFLENKDNSNTKYGHIILGLNWYPYSFIEIMPQYRIYSETPKIPNNSFLVQFHIWY